MMYTSHLQTNADSGQCTMQYVWGIGLIIVMYKAPLANLGLCISNQTKKGFSPM